MIRTSQSFPWAIVIRAEVITAICRRAVEDHQGTIQILSEVGKGTTVRLVLSVKNGANVKGLRGTRLAE